MSQPTLGAAHAPLPPSPPETPDPLQPGRRHPTVDENILRLQSDMHQQSELHRLNGEAMAKRFDDLVSLIDKQNRVISDMNDDQRAAQQKLMEDDEEAKNEAMAKRKRDPRRDSSWKTVYQESIKPNEKDLAEKADYTRGIDGFDLDRLSLIHI